MEPAFIRFPGFPHLIRAPALPSVLVMAFNSTDGRAGARMKRFAVFRDLEKVNLFLSAESEFVAIGGHS